MIEHGRVLLGIVILAGLSANGTASECARRNAGRASVAQIATHPADYDGRCVKVDGVMQGLTLYENVDGVYLRPPDSMNPSSSGLRIGLDNMERHISEDYEPVTVTGRVQDCETVRNMADATAGTDSVSFMAGYCHTSNGAYLWVNDVRRREAPSFARQVGHETRQDYGDLEPKPADWPYREMVERLAAGFLRALRTNDGEALIDMHFRSVGMKRQDDEAELLKFLLQDAGSPFAAIRTGTSAPQQVVLRAKLSQDRRDYSATVCFCRKPDCAGRWPIANFDADNLPTRPYACTDIIPYLINGQYVPDLSTTIARHGLTEPPAD